MSEEIPPEPGASGPQPDGAHGVPGAAQPSAPDEPGAASPGDPGLSVPEEPQPSPPWQASADPDGEHDFTVVNNFYDQVLGGTIGVAGVSSAAVRRGSGRVAAGDIECALRYYLPPPAHHQALSLLIDRHLVALVGREGCGRVAGSIALSRKVRTGESDLMRLPPTRTLAELAAHRGFKSGQAYLLHDWSPVTSDATAAWYDLDQLVTTLQDGNAYLVITVDRASTSKTWVSDVAVDWTEPDPELLFSHCVAELATPRLSVGDLARLQQRAAELHRPRYVVQLAELCIDGVEAALAEMGDAESGAVTSWFDAKPARWEVLTVTGLAFLSGITERRYERLLAALASAESAHRVGPGAADVSGQPADEDAFPQRRAALLNESKLAGFMIDRDPDMPVGTAYRPAFRTERHRMLFMAELHRLFGDDLWTPVHAWLFDLADQPFGEEHLAVGHGLAQLARFALGEVEEAYLEPWSAGRLRSRLLAVDVLWSMAQDDLLAPDALRIAVGWVQGRGQERAMTAAIAFGGPLGQRYPSEAMRWLWVLSQRSERIGRIARTAMGRLFAVEADAESGVSTVLRFLLRRVRPLLVPSVAPRERRAALAVVNSVLAVRESMSAAPVTARVIRERQADVAPVGELWAAVLQSVPHRRDAITALHDTLATLAQGSVPVQVAARLGAEILPRIGGDALATLRTALSDPERTREISRAVISAFLGATDRALGR